ncbi:hypothetical protein MSKU15_3264 [Komagataeibacter diospyri]|uniref:Uncharacterized protein n=1 Tax=Komagataeibacter diospyri TaxID=1932662 RepID=A0A4P5P2Z9_9PROT|nr:hypothetical protein MSKU9_2933 [Komagataeibacter diospyri]GCE91663.1 hypothetical protein MSKU15_3264 [Komagataeibacter diospyri]
MTVPYDACKEGRPARAMLSMLAGGVFRRQARCEPRRPVPGVVARVAVLAQR